MTDKINKYLSQLELEKNIKILWACETGSRAWGFPSTDSDYDIRLIYVHKKDWYLKLAEKKDTIERMLDNNDIDISGWELKKSLNLLRKSNASLLERIQSPIVYQSDDDFIRELLPLAQGFYSKIATIHHYLSMAKKFVEELKSDENYKLKKFFYTLRSALVCKWIIEREEMPPIEFHKIYPNLNLDKGIVDRISKLIKLKSTIEESYYHTGESELIHCIEDCINQAHDHKNNLPTSKGDLENLNLLFRKYISKYDN